MDVTIGMNGMRDAAAAAEATEAAVAVEATEAAVAVEATETAAAAEATEAAVAAVTTGMVVAATAEEARRSVPDSARDTVPVTRKASETASTPIRGMAAVPPTQRKRLPMQYRLTAAAAATNHR